MGNQCCVSDWISNEINAISNFVANDESQAQSYNLTEALLEESVDKALAKADYNWDGFISWDEYVYSLGDKEVHNHMKEYETHEVDHNKIPH